MTLPDPPIAGNTGAIANLQSLNEDYNTRAGSTMPAAVDAGALAADKAVQRIVVGPTLSNPKDDRYGAKGDGTTDDTAAFIAWGQALVGTSDPTSHSRTALLKGIVPPGIYVVGAGALSYLSSLGLGIEGCGPQVTVFRPTGNFGDYTSTIGAGTAILDVCGAYQAQFKDFTIDGTGWTGTALNGIQVYADTGRAQRTTTGVTFERVEVRNLAKCANYWAIGTNAATTQCDNVAIESNCRAIAPSSSFGAATLSSNIDNNPATTSFTVVDSYGWLSRLGTSNFVIKIDNEQILVGTRTGTSFTGCTRNYNGTTIGSHLAGANVDQADYLQNGFALGGPAYGNKYIYSLLNTVSQGFRYGYNASQTQVRILGGNPGNNGTDLRKSGQGYYEAGGFNSQNSRMLMESPGGNSFALGCYVHDIEYDAPGLTIPSSGVIGTWNASGVLIMRDVLCWNTGATPAKFTGAPTVALNVPISGCMSQADGSVFFTGTNVTAHTDGASYSKVNSSGQLLALQTL